MLRAFAHQIPAQFSPKVALPCSHPRPPWLPFPEHLVVDWHYCGAQDYFTLKKSILPCQILLIK
jgi:hypothetical protein